MKNVLLMIESPAMRDYFKKKLESKSVTVTIGLNGLDGLLKLRNSDTTCDLIIMDYSLSRLSAPDFLQQKHDNPNATSIPVIIISSKLGRKELIGLANFNVKKVFSKPIKIDAIFATISELLKININMDQTPCVIDTHMNEDILFVEVALGLNTEKIELVHYKIKELAELYGIQVPKILIIMTNLTLEGKDLNNLFTFFSNIIEEAKIDQRAVKVLTNSAFVRSFLSSGTKFNGIEVFDKLENAMDALVGLKVSAFIHEGQTIVKEDFLIAKGQKEGETIQMKFENDAAEQVIPGKEFTVGIVDDDMVAQTIVSNALSSKNYVTKIFDNGRLFVESIANNNFDLLFLDLMMPELDGFGVLKYMQANNISIPTIILSALSQKETVMEARKFGVQSYIIKPIEPEKILRKADEILHADF